VDVSVDGLEQGVEAVPVECGYPVTNIASITVLVVDDHALIRSAVQQALAPLAEIKLVVAAQDYVEARAQALMVHPTIVWLDMHVAHGDGVVEIARLRRYSPDSYILAVADVEDEKEAFAAIMAGAQGYCSKQDIAPDDIPELIHKVYQGELMMRPALVTHLVHHLRAVALPVWGPESWSGHRALMPDMECFGLALLTTREREILQLISEGYRDRDVAQGLCITKKTVEKHVQNILRKLGAHNRTEAAHFSRRWIS
jgi:DNA-binding NarL/FixJ family response regulator